MLVVVLVFFTVRRRVPIAGARREEGSEGLRGKVVRNTFLRSRSEGETQGRLAAAKMSGPDVLFPLRNNFYLGAFQAAINESNVRGLGDSDAVEKDSFVYRSYIALGQHQVSSAPL